MGSGVPAGNEKLPVTHTRQGFYFGKNPMREYNDALAFISDDGGVVPAAEGITMNLRRCLVLIGMLWPVSAFSAAGDTFFFTGDMLYRYCSQSSENCTSYVAGVVDALIAVGAAQKAPLICARQN
jgi:hypothetical protein